MSMEKLLAPEEAANLIAVSPRSIREWLRKGKNKRRKSGPLVEDTGRGFGKISRF